MYILSLRGKSVKENVPSVSASRDKRGRPGQFRPLRPLFSKVFTIEQSFLGLCVQASGPEGPYE